MKNLPLLTLALLLLGTATLLAEPEEQREPLLSLASDVDVPADQVDALVKGLEASPGRQVRIEATFLRIEGVRAAEILGEYAPDEMGSAGVVPEAFARQLIGCVRGPGSIRAEPLPPLVLYAGLTGRLTAGGRHTFIQDYDVEVSGTNRVSRPVIGGIHDGACVEATPRQEGEAITLDLEASWAEVIRPIPRFQTLATGVGSTLTIQLPEMHIAQVRGRVTLPAAGGYVLAGRGLAWDRESWRIVVLDVRPMPRGR